MKHATKAVLLLSALAVSACANVETATRQAPFEAEPPVVALSAPQLEPGTDIVTRAAFDSDELPAPEVQSTGRKLRIASYSVTVPRELRVSEANVFYPLGDIVWHGDPIGDRHKQVAAIFEDSLQRSAALMTEGRPANIEIEVMRFHSVTDKTRYTTGGVHSIKFRISARDAETGAVLIEPHVVKADLEAWGGQRAIEAERQGITQKFRVTNHLIKTLYQQVTGELPALRTARLAPADTTPVKAEGRIVAN